MDSLECELDVDESKLNRNTAVLKIPFGDSVWSIVVAKKFGANPETEKSLMHFLFHLIIPTLDSLNVRHLTMLDFKEHNQVSNQFLMDDTLFLFKSFSVTFNPGGCKISMHPFFHIYNVLDILSSVLMPRTNTVQMFKHDHA